MNRNRNSFLLEKASANLLINFSLLFTLTYYTCWNRLEKEGGNAQQDLLDSCPSRRDAEKGMRVGGNPGNHVGRKY